ncbi:MAG: hypothetical protein ACOC97_04895 [Myxococcota bacterium]
MKATCLLIGAMGLSSLGGCSWFGEDDDEETTGDAGPEDAAADEDAGQDAGMCVADGAWTVDEALEYSCCGGLVTYTISQLHVSSGGDLVQTAPDGLDQLRGPAVDCPGGTFDHTASSSEAGCSVSAHLGGELTAADRWEGSLELTFEGTACTCGGADPCVDRSFDFTATR